MPTADELGVETAAYLNGMAEAASELRRQVLDQLRAGDATRAEALFAIMDEVYALLVTDRLSRRGDGRSPAHYRCVASGARAHARRCHERGHRRALRCGGRDGR